MRWIRILALGVLSAVGSQAAITNEMQRWSGPATNEMASLNSMLETFREKHKLPALVAAVASSSELLAAGATGRRRIDEDERVTLRDKMHIGSCTKSMTALLAVMLAEQEEVKLTDTVTELLPSGFEATDGFEKVTLTHLLQHRSGIFSQPPKELWARAFHEFSGSGLDQRKAYFEEALQLPLENEPGETFEYSNSGYSLVGFLLENKVGTPWEELMHRYIFDPLKLDSAGFGPPSSPENNDHPSGHVWKGEEAVLVPRVDNPAAIAPGGAVHLSTLDLARYAAFHLAVAQGKISSLRSWRDQLYSPPEGSHYSFGWVIVQRPWAGGKAITHTGSNTMFFCVIWLAPARDMAFVVATNVAAKSLENPSDAACDEVVAALIKKFLPAEKP